MQDYGTMTPAQRAWQDEWQRQQDAYACKLSNAFAFWRDCEEPRCRRDHRCRGDQHTCSSRGWARIPEDGKVWFRAAVKALLADASFEEATRVGDFEAERWRALQEEQGSPDEA